MIDTPDVFDHAVGAITGQVAGAVQAFASVSERIGDKTLGCQCRTIQIPTSQAAGAADIQLAHRPQGCEVEIAVQDIQGAPWQRAANRAGGSAQGFIRCAAIQHTGHHRRLGRPIGIEQTHMAQASAYPLCGPVQRHGFAADVHLAQGTIRTGPRGQAIKHKQVPIGGRQIGQGNPLAQDLGIQPAAVP
ncbi:hypothetical protein GCM10009086_25190 [Pseudomonas rhodesiae]